MLLQSQKMNEKRQSVIFSEDLAKFLLISDLNGKYTHFLHCVVGAMHVFERLCYYLAYIAFTINVNVMQPLP